MEKERDLSLRELPGATRVVVVVDMVGYSTLARLLEENAGAGAVAQLNRQIQEFVEAGVSALPVGAATEKIAETGDGAILLFESAGHAHTFAKQVLIAAGEHNESRTDESAKRWFRIGIASGEVTRKDLNDEEGGYAGIAIANAVRLESAAERGEIVVDVATFDELPAAMRKVYGPESTIRGKRTEVFRVRRHRVAAGGRRSPGWYAVRGTVGVTRRMAWMAAILVVCLVAIGGYLSLHRSSAPPFQRFTIRQITDTGDFVAAAVSPDGRYLLSAIEENGQQSLWLRNLPTNSNTRVIAPADASYKSLAFSSDGNYIYFRQRVSSSGDASDLYRAPVLGGAPQLVVRAAESGVSFSGDGKRIAFTRSGGPGIDRFSLVISNPDGTDERVVTTGPESFFPGFVAWSPNNREIALATTGPGQGEVAVRLYSLASSTSKVLARFEDLPLQGMTWSPDGSGLLVTYENNIGYETRNQIGFISSPTGKFRTVTSDTNDYGEASISADGATLTTVQRKVTHTLYEMPGEGFGGETPSAAAAQSRDAAMFGWGADGSIYFGNAGSLLRVSADGASRSTILSDPVSNFIRPSVCSDGRFLVFVWSNHDGNRKTNTWRVGTDGSNPKQLTFGQTDVSPVCSPDGKWVYYDAVNPLRILRVPVEGGSPEEVPGAGGLVNTTRLKLSGDGRLLVFFRASNEPAATRGKIVLVPLDAGPKPQVKMLEADPRCIGLVQFTPDGRALVYVIRENGTDNLWQQPLDGSAGKQLTKFRGDIIEFFEFSKNGKTLGVIRTHSESDVVLLRDTGLSPR